MTSTAGLAFHFCRIFILVWVHFFVCITHCSPVVDFCTPWKRHKTFGFLMFLGGIEMEHWAKIDGCLFSGMSEELMIVFQEREPVIIYQFYENYKITICRYINLSRIWKCISLFSIWWIAWILKKYASILSEHPSLKLRN